MAGIPAGKDNRHVQQACLNSASPRKFLTIELPGFSGRLLCDAKVPGDISDVHAELE